jgi:hypothetical protein
MYFKGRSTFKVKIMTRTFPGVLAAGKGREG